MALSTAGAAAMNAGLAAVAGFASLHSGDPGAAGTLLEIVGGTPAYIRKQILWTPPTTDVLDSSNTPIFDVPAGAHIAYFGLWSLAVGGTFYGSGAVTVEDYVSQGQYRLLAAVIDSIP